MYITKPEKNGNKWDVEIVYYPESRSIDVFRFATKALAQEFYDNNADKKPTTGQKDGAYERPDQ